MTGTAITDTKSPASVGRLLEATRETMTKARYCWAVTATDNGRVNARPMGRVAGLPGEDALTIWFLTRRGAPARRRRSRGPAASPSSSSTMPTMLM